MRRTRAAVESLPSTLRRSSRLALAAALCADLAALALADVTAPARIALVGLVAGVLLLRPRRAGGQPAQASRSRMADLREQERRRLGQDLHDSLGPTLAAVLMRADAASSLIVSDPSAARSALNGLTDEARSAITKVRTLAQSPGNPDLRDMSLACALGAQAARLGRASAGRLVVRVDASDDESLSQTIALAAYHIACEALTNVAKHSRARSATVRLRPALGGTAVRLEITDDGTGLPVQPRSGVGLNSMRQRARELGGTCTIENAAPCGTRVLAILPAKPAPP
jgi:two-component system NarL family sensor kinase